MEEVRFSTYIDLFSGIGGFPLGIYRSGIKFDNHYFSEIDERCISLYSSRFTDSIPLGDVRNHSAWILPKGSSVVTAGFPCVDLSVARYGSHEGLDGKESGLFYYVTEFVNREKPDWVILENVPRMLKYLNVVKETMPLLYWEGRIYDSQDFGVCCRRKRTYIVGHIRSGSSRKIFDQLEEYKSLISGRRSKDVLPTCLPWKGGVSLERLGSCIVDLKETHPTRIRKSNGFPRTVDSHRYLQLGNAVIPKMIELIFRGILICEIGD